MNRDEIVSGWVLFLSVCGIYTALRLSANGIIFTDEFFYRSLSGQLTIESIESLLNIRAKLWWIDYLTIPVILVFRTLFASICISIGLVLFEKSFSFSKLFKIALLAEGVFMLGELIYLIQIFSELESLTLHESINYYPLSLMSVVGIEHALPFLYYPLQTLNFFEILYICVISGLLSLHIEGGFKELLSIVMPAYLTGLILWLSLVAFLTLQVS
ncbi:MAG: hypothetical protein R3281_15650 [Balneolaceae bacterium]|nr:hypothetical protein [Balneolaceae bacterium]